MAERIHALVLEAAPVLVPRTYYGMPAYAKDGKTICFFQPKSKFKVRYSTFGFQPDAKVDDGELFPIAFARDGADARGGGADRRTREEGRQLNTGRMADWGAIEVRGARENNLRNISLDIPKRRLTVFTGVSGSGKSSLVFETIAAESQRLINETYSAFVQGFMPTLARPDVDSLEGLTTAIILDQERMGANVRSTVGTVTDANAMLRVVFSRIGKPHIGGPQAFSFNIPSVTGGGAIKVERGSGVTESRTFSIAGGMCPRCEGMGTASDIDLTRLYDETKSLAEGAITVPGYTADGWSTRMFSESGFLIPDKKSATTPRPSGTISFTRSRPRSGSMAST